MYCMPDCLLNHKSYDKHGGGGRAMQAETWHQLVIHPRWFIDVSLRSSQLEILGLNF